LEATLQLGIGGDARAVLEGGGPMSKDDELNRAVGDLFDQYFRYDQTLDDSKVLDALLPDNSTVVRGLGERCLEEARNRLRAGHHTEGRRLEILARQLLKRADKAKR
jgi:hypothetical protein